MFVHASTAPLIFPAPRERMRIPVFPVKAVIGIVMFTEPVVVLAMFVPTCVHSVGSYAPL